jgi:hypothetical protein
MTVRIVREGHGANCSSIGSVVDTLFVAELVAGALFVAVVASLSSASDTASETASESESGSETNSDSKSAK